MNYPRIEDEVIWRQFGELPNFRFSILHIDDAKQRAEVLFKFEEGKPIILHRHTALNKLLVISGEHHIYSAAGELKEVRPCGSYTVSEPCDTPHSECGGQGGAIVLFSIFDNEGKSLYELLDESENVIATLTMADLVALQ